MEQELILTEEPFTEGPRLSEEQLQEQPYAQLRRVANVQGGLLMIYKVIMNMAVFAVMFLAAIVWAFELFGPKTDHMQDLLESMMEQSGWGYLLAVLAGWLTLRLWKRNSFFQEEVYKPGKPMTIGAFFALVAIVFGIQVPAQLWTMGLEWVCNRFDRSIVEILEQNALDMDHIAVWLYVCLAAPVWEELLFRGLVLRSLEPYGKRFAILVSSVLFGLYHGSPIQTPYAILVGLVLGFVATEYNVVWAMVLHMMNNLLLSDTLPRLLECLPYQVGETILWVFLGICFLTGLIVLILKWRDVAAWRKVETLELWQHKAFWKSPCIVILTVWCLLDLGMYFVLMFL